MQFAEIGKRLVAERNRAGAARMIPSRRRGLHGNAGCLAPGRVKSRQRISLGGERVGPNSGLHPVPQRFTRAQARGHIRLRAGLARSELRADFEEQGVGEAARLVARTGRQEGREQARAHGVAGREGASGASLS